MGLKKNEYRKRRMAIINKRLEKGHWRKKGTEDKEKLTREGKSRKSINGNLGDEEGPGKL